MQFNRSSEADEAMKNYAGRKAASLAQKAVKKAGKSAGKAGKKAGKEAGKAAGRAAKFAAQKIWFTLAGVVGAPAAFCILVVVLFLFLLPGAIFSSTLGTDNASPDGTIITTVGSSWEDDAKAALNERYSQLTSVTFWNDLGTFFSTGHWGTSGEVFQTEYAKANELDENGESVSEGYFSSSNRLVAILNETFRSSLRDDAQAMQIARNMANASLPQYEAMAQIMDGYKRPADVAPEDYHIVSKIEKDTQLDEQNFIYESCYLLAATSAAVENYDSYNVAVRETLDYAFLITGLDYLGVGQKICWEPSVFPSYSVDDQEVTVGYRYFDENGDEVSADSPDVIEVVPIKKKVRTVTVTLHYSVMLKSDYKDIILEHCNIEDLPASAPAYEISQKDQIQQSAIELIKLYGGSGGGFAELGDVGQPLPSSSYYISSGFGWRTLYGEANFHSGIDLAAPLGTEVYAVKDGVCSVKPFHSSYGNYVTIDHGNGVQTRYAHMSAVLVADGESVVAGQVIGLVGSTGNSTGNHLHLEVIVNGSRIDALSTDLGEPILNGSK